MIASSVQPYRGRFAPSPSGPLHFGSLLTALASYLQAHSQQGQWFVRIEDIDPPRETPGSADLILHSLDAYGLHWHGDVRYQSQQSERYLSLLASLAADQRSYPCSCIRKRLRFLPHGYDQHCKKVPPEAGAQTAIRFDNRNPVNQFSDLLMGKVVIDCRTCQEDFIIRRKDGLFAYQLAVVADDIDQGITEIVRGRDLLDSTPKQIALFNYFNAPLPTFVHLPLAVTNTGHKLSKQNHAEAIDNTQVEVTLIKALQVLGQNPPSQLAQASRSEILAWAKANWSLTNIPQHNIVM